MITEGELKTLTASQCDILQSACLAGIGTSDLVLGLFEKVSLNRTAHFAGERTPSVAFKR